MVILKPKSCTTNKFTHTETECDTVIHPTTKLNKQEEEKEEEEEEEVATTRKGRKYKNNRIPVQTGANGHSRH